MRVLVVAVLVVSALAAAGCSPARYSYRPTAATAQKDAPTSVDGQPAAGYPVPRGEIELAALGVERMKPPWRGAHDQPMIHVRMIARNGTRQIWVVDGADQSAVIAERAPEGPSFSTTDGVNTQPGVIMPGESRRIDLYYPWPEGLAVEKKLPPVVVQWRVRTPSGVMAQATSAFEPHQIPKPVIVVPPPDPHQMARELETRPAPPTTPQAPDRDGLPGDGVTR
ncbi:MAG TPA: hypothetical protein VN947_20805 [Polyangia bacterium]|nr:hypothetical protein [Polyangia bacterium]